MAEGDLELMLHRRCSGDDNKGVSETLNEVDHVSVSLRLLLEPATEAAASLRHLSLQHNFAPTPLFAPTASAKAYAQAARTSIRPLLARALPPNVHLLSLEQRYGPGNATLLRLQHVFEAGEHAQLSKPVSLDLASALHPSFQLASAVEMSLSANMRKASLDATRLQWRVANDTSELAAGLPRAREAAAAAASYPVTLKAREIRTFLLNAQPLDPALDY